jgi:hypothetical protein
MSWCRQRRIGKRTRKSWGSSFHFPSSKESTDPLSSWRRRHADSVSYIWQHTSTGALEAEAEKCENGRRRGFAKSEKARDKGSLGFKLTQRLRRRKLMNGFLQSVWRLHDTARIHVHCMAWAVRAPLPTALRARTACCLSQLPAAAPQRSALRCDDCMRTVHAPRCFPTLSLRISSGRASGQGWRTPPEQQSMDRKPGGDFRGRAGHERRGGGYRGHIPFTKSSFNRCS